MWVGLLQVAHHGTDHRAQILRALYDLGAPTFEQNFALYMEHLTPMTVQEVLARIGAKRAEWMTCYGRSPPGRWISPFWTHGR